MPRKRSESHKPRKRTAKVRKTPTASGPSLISALLELMLSIRPMRSQAMKYLMRAELEFLKGLKTLLESQIQIVEKRMANTKKRRVKKIDIVEE